MSTKNHLKTKKRIITILGIILALCLIYISYERINNVQTFDQIEKFVKWSSQLDSINENTEVQDEEEIFVEYEHIAKFPGGASACKKFIKENMKFPIEAIEGNIQGRVTCQFTVFKDGHIGDIKVVRGIHPSLDKEAIRLLSIMPNWKPGGFMGKDTDTKYTIPIVFKIE